MNSTCFFNFLKNMAHICGLFYISMGWRFTAVILYMLDPKIPEGLLLNVLPPLSWLTCFSGAGSSTIFWEVLSDSSSVPLLYCVSPIIIPQLNPECFLHAWVSSSSPLIPVLLDCEFKDEDWICLAHFRIPGMWHCLVLKSSCNRLVWMNEEWINEWINSPHSYGYSSPRPMASSINFRKSVICYDQNSERTLKKLTEEMGKVNVALPIIISFHTSHMCVHVCVCTWRDFLLKGYILLTGSKVYWTQGLKCLIKAKETIWNSAQKEMIEGIWETGLLTPPVTGSHTKWVVCDSAVISTGYCIYRFNNI